MGHPMSGPSTGNAPRPRLSSSVGGMDNDRTFDFVPVPMESVPLWWDQVERLYRDTPETWEDYDNIESIYDQHMRGHRLLYVALEQGLKLEFAISGTVQTWPTGKTVVLDWCAGRDIKRYLSLALSSLEDLARQVDAFEVKFVGREGWKKHLEPFGYRVTHVTYTKRLEGTAPRRS